AVEGEAEVDHSAGRARAETYRLVSFAEIRLWFRHRKTSCNPSNIDLRIAPCKTPTIANARGVPKSKKCDRSRDIGRTLSGASPGSRRERPTRGWIERNPGVLPMLRRW